MTPKVNIRYLLTAGITGFTTSHLNGWISSLWHICNISIYCMYAIRQLVHMQANYSMTRSHTVWLDLKALVSLWWQLLCCWSSTVKAFDEWEAQHCLHWHNGADTVSVCVWESLRVCITHRRHLAHTVPYFNMWLRGGWALTLQIWRETTGGPVHFMQCLQ